MNLLVKELVFDSIRHRLAAGDNDLVSYAQTYTIALQANVGGLTLHAAD